MESNQAVGWILKREAKDSNSGCRQQKKARLSPCVLTNPISMRGWRHSSDLNIIGHLETGL